MTSETAPFLIVDKKGLLGAALCEKLSSSFPVVFVSRAVPPASQNILHISYAARIPKIPQIPYRGILIIDDASRITRDSLPAFLKKAAGDKAPFYFVTHLPLIESLAEKMTQAYAKAVVVVLGEIFMEKGMYDQSLINEFIFSASKKGAITLSPTGLEKMYPVFFDDVISHLSEIIKTKSSSQTVLLFPKNGFTQLSVSRMLQKGNPLLRVDFARSHTGEPEISIPHQGTYVLGDAYPLAKRFERVDFSQNSEFFKKRKTAKPISKKNMMLGVYIAIVLIFLPFVMTFIFAVVGFLNLAAAKADLERADFIHARQNAQMSQTFFVFSQKASAPWSLFDMRNTFLSGVFKTITTGRELADAGALAAEGAWRLQAVLTGNSKYPTADVRTVSQEGETLITMLQKLQIDKGLPQLLQKNLTRTSSLFQLATLSLPLLPDLIGADSQKTYLVLFQNNMELRPGGGFIGSYGLLTLNRGAIKNFSFFDVYDADGQLKGHIEPPYPIRRYIPQVHWYMRDSNFDVDFPSSASQAAQFLYLEKGTVVDGVIAVDTSFLKNILKATGPVYLPDYNKTVTADNVFLLTEEAVEKNFFPGSTQKKDFLRSLATTLQESIFSKKSISPLTLFSAINDSLVQKHLLFAFPSQTIEQQFARGNFSSTIADGAASDFLGINEANMGSNKVNYFIRRKVAQSVSIHDDGVVQEQITIRYKNLSSGWPGGDYTNYLRFILPLGATISKVTIDNSDQVVVPAVTDYSTYEASGFTSPLGLEVDQKEELGKTVFGFLVKVPESGTKTISVTYTLPARVGVDQPTFSYNTHFLKQPGTDEYPFTFSLSYPKTFQPLTVSPWLKNINGQLFYSGVVNSDVELGVTFGKNQ
ncbi:MAG TPA: DUF4012 domain-containing protein [Candidatus Saccharimonadales bacterium]|nr:DUF4012 domain-containing protein [Candidatus Saccharimonadales bacterium]